MRVSIRRRVGMDRWLFIAGVTIIAIAYDVGLGWLFGYSNDVLALILTGDLIYVPFAGWLLCQ